MGILPMDVVLRVVGRYSGQNSASVNITSEVGLIGQAAAPA